MAKLLEKIKVSAYQVDIFILTVFWFLKNYFEILL